MDATVEASLVLPPDANFGGGPDGVAFLEVSRFAVREAVPDDAEEIARTHVASWRASYRGILPDDVLDGLDVGHRASSRRSILRDQTSLHLVAYEVSGGDIVGFCDAGPRRRDVPYDGEIYALYLEHRAKRYGLGREMFEQSLDWLSARGMRSLVIWVLEENHHARRFYEAMGGREALRVRSSVGRFPVWELGYVWDRV
jgi:GNAT superfamily N-acetyltransferase